MRNFVKVVVAVLPIAVLVGLALVQQAGTTVTATTTTRVDTGVHPTPAVFRT